MRWVDGFLAGTQAESSEANNRLCRQRSESRMATFQAEKNMLFCKYAVLVLFLAGVPGTYVAWGGGKPGCHSSIYCQTTLFSLYLPFKHIHTLQDPKQPLNAQQRRRLLRLLWLVHVTNTGHQLARPQHAAQPQRH